MEVDSVVAPKLQPTEPKVIFNIGILSDTTNGFGEAEGGAPILATTFAEL